MKTIITFVTLFFVATAAVSSAALYLNENYILSAALCIFCILSLSFWIKSAGVTVVNSEKHAQ
jgi:hypothetical protein